MKFICTQENLHKGLLKVQNIASGSYSLPILKNILLETENGTLKLKSTDLEIGITTEVRGRVEKEGKITVESGLISGFVSLLPQDKVELSIERNSLIIKSGSHKTKINGISAEDFPVIPEVKKEKGIKINAQDFKKSVAQIIPSISIDDTRPEINGMYFEIKDNTLTLAGTDSYRLAEKRLSIDENKNFSGSFIVPLKTIKELVKTIDDNCDFVEIYVSENQILFVYNLTEVVSRLVDGEYPDYKQIIPQAGTVSFKISKDDFLNSVRISGVFAQTGANSVVLDINTEKNIVLISSSTTLGDEKTVLKADVEGEKGLKVVFDYRYLIDGLSSIGDDEVVFLGTSESSPALIKPVDENEKMLYVVMPIRQ